MTSSPVTLTNRVVAGIVLRQGGGTFVPQGLAVGYNTLSVVSGSMFWVSTPRRFPSLSDTKRKNGS